MNKVYCKNCKYHIYSEYDGYVPIPDRCIHPLIAKEIPDAVEKLKKEVPCSHINLENDCKHYKRKWWKFWVR